MNEPPKTFPKHTIPGFVNPPSEPTSIESVDDDWGSVDRLSTPAPISVPPAVFDKRTQNELSGFSAKTSDPVILSAVTMMAPPDEEPRLSSTTLVKAPEELNPVPDKAAPPAKPDPYIGVTIDGRYKIESVLGEGGMGVVYAARHKVINKRVAIKILRADLSRDREMTDRFLQEARAASSIGHPNIVDVIDFGELPDGSAYFAMEFLEGKSLATLLGEEKTLPLPRLIAITKQVAAGLGAAHAQQIVHRDLKPDNIFLTQRGLEKDAVKILDFGIAKVTTSSTTKLTRAGTVFGTPHYMSPEQAAGAPVDHRTDIYALGIILYEMAVGKVPFDADNYMGILTQHMYKAPVPIRAIVPAPANTSALSPGLEAIVLKALSKKPEQRYASMSEVVEEFEKLEKGVMPTAVSDMIARSGAFNVPADYFSSGAMSDVFSATPNHKRPKWSIYAGIAGVAVVIGLVLVIMFADRTGTAQTKNLAAAPSAPVPTQVLPPTPSSIIEPIEKTKAVMVLVEPIDAEVFRNGINLGKSPITLDLRERETINLEIRREGFNLEQLTIDGSKQRVEVKLTKSTGKAALPAPQPGPAQGPVPAPVRTQKKPSGGDVVDPWGH